MNRQQMISQTLLWEQVAAKAKARAAEFRQQLTDEARAELEAQGTAPTWRLQDVGTVTLPVSQETVYVSDSRALLEWVQARHSDEVEIVQQVRGAFQAQLLADARVVTADGERVAITPDGEFVPGLAVRPGGVPQSLSFRPSREAKAFAGDYADKLLAEVEQQLGGGQ